MHLLLLRDRWLDNIKICDSISCDILQEIVWRHQLRHISLDDVQLYAAFNTPIQDETAKVH